MKRIALIVLTCLAVTVCSKSGQSNVSGSFTSPDPSYAGYDLNRPVTMHVYMVGDTPKDIDEVISKANAEYFKPILNTTVELIFIPWSDLATKYALILAGGEDVDIIFTAGWCYYDQESTKGSFVELTEDFRTKWLPITNKELPPTAWLQMLTKGKVFATPQMISQFDGYKYVVIRDDLRTKYRLPELTGWASLEKYLFTVAENEPSIQAFAAPSSTIEIMYVYQQLKDIMAADYSFVWTDTDQRNPRPEDLTYIYMTDWYLDYAKIMSDWANKGVWSKNAMNNTIPVTDSFIQGKSATTFWNMSVFTAGKSMEDNGVGKAGYYDITADKPVRLSGYGNNAFALASASPYPERAALTLDLMKTNVALVNLLQGGIEGRHYLDQGDGTYLAGPEAEDYGFNNWGWGLNNPNGLQLAFDDSTPAARPIIEASQRSRVWEPLIDGFRVDSSSFTTEWAVISALNEEYGASFGCGAFGNQTEAKMREYWAKMRAAGIDKVSEIYRAQYADFLARYAKD